MYILQQCLRFLLNCRAFFVRIEENKNGKKARQFDSFAGESVVGEESLKPLEAAWIGRMVEEEKKRLLEAPEE